LHPDADDPNDASNAFTYEDDDGKGIKTPRFAHIRKVNPRDEQQPQPDDPQLRRMLRRGIPFGTPYKEGEEDGHQRGLHFLAFVIDLDMQFEFVQRNWINNANFPNGAIPPTPGGDYQTPTGGEPADGPDPVVSEHDVGAQDTLHLQGGATAELTLPKQLIHMTGGEYFFAPSIKCLADLRSSPPISN
jgi:deferrochelatase/peroxidase EfeB